MKARRALEQRRLAIAVAASTSAAAAMLVSRYVDRRRRPLQTYGYAATLTEAMSSLQTYGVGVVDDVIGQGIIHDLKSTSVFQSMPKQASPHASSQEWRVSAVGRYHRREETFTEDDLKVFERVEKSFWPLVDAFFQADGDGGAQEGIFRSEMQILNAVPGSKDQTWHSDNRSRGLSIIVPLVDFTAENGATELLLGSHNKSWSLLADEGAQTVHARVGAVAAYDSRTYHRGLGNQTGDGRPALIFCYDRPSSPPPGCGAYGSIANANLAHLLNIASTAWIACSSMWKRAGAP